MNAVAGAEATDNAALKIRIARYQGDRAAALSLTFDDTSRDQDKNAVPLLEKLGFPGTFFVIANTTPDTDAEAALKKLGDHGGISWRRLKELANHGHEIGNHSWTHANLRKADDAKLEEEVNRAYDRIAEKIGTPPLSFCYPGNGYDDRVRTVVLQRHVADRTFQAGCGGKNFTLELANRRIDDTIRDGKWLVAMIHGITAGYEPFTSLELFAKHLDFVKSQEGKIWVDTMGNVSRYIQERDTATLNAERSAGKATFTLTCPLTPEQFNVPLTVVIPAAKTATKIVASRNGATQSLPTTFCGDRILVETVPSVQPVTVTWVE